MNDPADHQRRFAAENDATAARLEGSSVAAARELGTAYRYAAQQHLRTAHQLDDASVQRLEALSDASAAARRAYRARPSRGTWTAYHDAAQLEVTERHKYATGREDPAVRVILQRDYAGEMQTEDGPPV